MKRILVGMLTLGIIALMFMACAAPSRISKAAVDQFTLGETTMDEIKGVYGTQDLTHELYTPETGLTKISYAYRDPSDNACQPDVYAIQQVDFFFKKEVLYGVQYMSSTALDCTKFDDSKVSEIQVGKTTKDEIKDWFGSPDGKFFTDGPEPVWRYLYVQKKTHKREYDHQVLDVYFDEKGVVDDFKLDFLMGF
ncbi:MAG: outer membrane protein assembly factor BamE [Deltaproteobacteria bacterium]|nr:outer membrane protein assembly factor BamE [Deltaproteobacteria bacterium]